MCIELCRGIITTSSFQVMVQKLRKFDLVEGIFFSHENPLDTPTIPFALNVLFF